MNSFVKPNKYIHKYITKYSGADLAKLIKEKMSNH